MSFILIMNTDTLQDRHVFDEKFANVPKARQNKISKYYYNKDKCLSLAAGILLDTGLKRYGLQANSVFFAQNPYGKTHLRDVANIHYNISHSGIYAVCAFSSHSIGVDIEKQEPLEDVMALALASLHLDEYTKLAQSEQDSISAVFYSIWAAKESFSKNLGIGMSLETKSYALPYPIKEYTWENTIYYFKEYILKDYVISLCTQEQNFSLELEYIIP